MPACVKSLNRWGLNGSGNEEQTCSLFTKVFLFASLATLAACGVDTSSTDPPGDSADGTCTSVFPSYWQDPNPKFATMWEGQAVSDVPPENWSGPVFRLSDAYPAAPPDEAADQPWRDER